MKKLGINVAAGILDIINTILVGLSWFVVGTAAVGEALDDSAAGVTSGVAIIFYGMVGIGLIVHIVALVMSKKVGISITGHVVGIIGCALFLFTMLLALPAFVLLIIAAVFSLKQSPVKTREFV
ncbi:MULTISPECIES: transporter [Carnobacterium]|uniref:Transporter n=1 Tax=Carnobacterium maltaromaticum TaxID=2751 RepID=A0AAW9JR13_CARML|nr:transporter [Carnobacterium maltaromaticum]MDZ5758033.1 transporter [Carnobacterium maltaromaticum]TFJ75009.1 transporter [Carnobacterium maltaromaticum]TFJ78269.1 transporter [Carnobacterium maltaromaticum]CAD5898337.1 conserved membrane hypothetical protein [Carnobacterium maltaromaticum]CAD5898721.1 conserved membrane hypothetical protein [Carnobacterium maltaromaticum]